MTENNDTNDPQSSPEPDSPDIGEHGQSKHPPDALSASSEQEPRADGEDGSEERAPRRVIGTPPPATARYLLPGSGNGDGDGDGAKRDDDEFDEQAAQRAERVVALCFSLAFVGGIAFIVAYAVVPGTVGEIDKAMWSNYALGASLTLALLGLAVGMTIWVRRVMTTKPIVQERGQLASSAEDKRAFTEHFLKGAEESGITKRPLLRRSLLAAAVPLGLAPLVLLRDLGPLPRERLRHTSWKKGTRMVVDGTGQPIKATDFNSPGGIITVVPEGDEGDLTHIAKSAVLLVNIPPEQLRLPAGRENWHVNGIVAYSKICTHVGCPAALYEQTTRHILCPCHQSTFDATRGAKVIFGPAARPLPMLQIGVDGEGYLIAENDFTEPVGPSFWERG